MARNLFFNQTRPRATSLVQTYEIKILLNLSSIILVLIFVYVKTLIMLMLFLEQTRTTLVTHDLVAWQQLRKMFCIYGLKQITPVNGTIHFSEDKQKKLLDLLPIKSLPTHKIAPQLLRATEVNFRRLVTWDLASFMLMVHIAYITICRDRYPSVIECRETGAIFRSLNARWGREQRPLCTGRIG